jgi:zinc protease
MRNVLSLILSCIVVCNLQAGSPDRIQNHHLYYQQDLRVPMTSLTTVFHGAGSQQESADKAGLAGICAKMLFRGTSNMNRETIAKKFELLGADVNASASETDFVVSISCFTRNIDDVLRLTSTVLKEASFPADELELVRKQELNSLEAVLQEPDAVLGKAHEYVIFAGSPLGKFGSRTALNKVTRDDVASYYNAVLGTQVLYFTSISNLPKKEIEKRLLLFTRQRRTDGFALKPEQPYSSAAGQRAYIFSSPGATNDRFIWSHKGIDANDPRRFDLDLVADALGSGQGFLFDQLRNQKGWCYGAYAFVLRGTGRTGRIGYYADPTSESSPKLIPEMLHLIQSFASEEDWQRRFVQRNSTFKSRFAYTLDLRFRLNSEVNRDRYGIPILDKQAYFDAIDAVNLESARRTISEVFDTKNMFMVFYGDPDRIRTTLENLDSKIEITVLEKEVLVE